MRRVSIGLEWCGMNFTLPMEYASDRISSELVIYDVLDSGDSL